MTTGTPLSTADAIEKVMSINGWVREDWLETLAKYIKPLPPGSTVVEIGTALGRSCNFFGLINPDINIYTLDNYTDWYNREAHPESLDEFQKWHKEVVKRHLDGNGVTNVHQIIADSNTYEWTKGPIDILYWDGGTAYDTVKADYDRWQPLVKKGGYYIWGGYLFEPGEIEGMEVKAFVNDLDLFLESESNIAALKIK